MSKELIRVLYVYSAGSYGGLVRNLSHIANHIDQTRFDTTFIALVADGDSGFQLDLNCERKTTFETIADNKKLDFTALSNLANRCRSEEFDILSVHGHKADFYALLLKLFYRSRLPITSIAHGWVVPGIKMKFYDLIDKLSMLVFNKIVLVNSQQFIELPLHSRQKLEVIPNAIPLCELPSVEKVEEARFTLGLSEDEIAIGFCGRLSEEKGVKKLIDGFAKLESEKTRLYICGDGRQRKELEKHASNLGVAQRVHFLGFVENVFEVLAAFDIYCSCSAREGLPNSVLEAQIYGLACVLNDIAAHQEIIKTQDAAVLVNCDDASALASQLNELIESRDYREKLAKAARRNVEQNFTINSRIKKLESLYENLASTT